MRSCSLRLVPTTWPPPTITLPFRARCKTSPPSLARHACARSMLPILTPSPRAACKLGDRACLRAVHYWYENGLVDKRWAALNAGDIDQFLVLTRESGASSAMYLQNVVAKLGSEQPSMYALALAEHVLDGRGAVRIHGGGFGGTIQAFVPLDLVDTFIAKMNGWLGEGSAVTTPSLTRGLTRHGCND